MNEISFIKFLTLILTIILFLFSAETQANVNDKSKLNIIVINAGHGGKYYGASLDGIMEKILYSISLKSLGIISLLISRI